MATSVVSLPSYSPAIRAGRSFWQEERFALSLVTALTVFALVIHGYHPYAEDGGPYMVGVKHLLNPALYPHASEFATPHPRFSFFAAAVALLTRASHLPLEIVLAILHFASIWATLYAAWRLASQCFPQRAERSGAVALLAAWLTLPIAGTSILLMDPYVTARSLSTPCTLFALSGLVSFLRPKEYSESSRWRGLLLCCLSLGVATAMHPLMAAYAFGYVLVLACQLSPKRSLRLGGTLGLILLAIVLAGVVQSTAPADTAQHLQAELTRVYWFLSFWHWYEIAGLVAPLAILAAEAFYRKGTITSALAQTAIACSLAALAVALLFCRVSLTSHAVAWLQPLRVLQLTYILMILGLGALMGRYLFGRSIVLGCAVFGFLGSTMLFAERQTFPHSPRFELPGIHSNNPWEQAFLWIRSNTPQDAFFALDSDYIVQPEEDAQNFRALAERSSLPDRTKDGGDAANNAPLSSAWVDAQALQKDLSSQPDSQRIANLRPVGVDWVVLKTDAATGFSCPYQNRRVKVCRLPQ
ncbi:MAG TPA: hypothetical protein VGB69_11750 [Edaphobacter sp.]